MVDIYRIAAPLALSTLSSHTAMTALHNTLESIYNTHLPNGARRRRSGGGPGGGCARRPVGTYLYLHAVGASNPVAVACLAR
jgi:hypothetical protein